MDVTVGQKVKGKGKSWRVFVCHDGRRISRKVRNKAAAQGVASKTRAKLQLGKFGFEEEKKSQILHSRSMQIHGSKQQS